MGGTSNNVHVSMIVDDQVTNTGFYVRCQMYDGTPSINAFFLEGLLCACLILLL